MRQGQDGAPAAIIPIGKYRGQPIETLLADTEYRDWLLAQPWFKEKYLSLYQVIINYGGEPQDSPEHNEMQASFLDDERCLRVARLLFPGRPFDEDAAIRIYRRNEYEVAKAQKLAPWLEMRTEAAGVINRMFEDRGWDLTFGIAPAALVIATAEVELPACTCGPCLHDECGPDSKCNGGSFAWCRHKKHQENRPLLRYPEAHCWDRCPWHDRDMGLLMDPHDGYADLGLEFTPSWDHRIGVELKPDLGDDFPAVLRQVLRYENHHGDGRGVIVRRHQFTTVTWDQVKEMFASSGVTLIAESELEVHP